MGHCSLSAECWNYADEASLALWEADVSEWKDPHPPASLMAGDRGRTLERKKPPHTHFNASGNFSLTFHKLIRLIVLMGWFKFKFMFWKDRADSQLKCKAGFFFF